MILDVIKRNLERQKKNNWYESYWAFDLHGTVIRPNHIRGIHNIEFYPYAVECLQMISAREDIRMILSTSSYPEEIQNYLEQLNERKIYFDYLNQNPEIHSYEDFGYYYSKFYFDVMFEDKCGFDPETEWNQIYNFLMSKDFKPIDKIYKNSKRDRVKIFLLNDDKL